MTFARSIHRLTDYSLSVDEATSRLTSTTEETCTPCEERANAQRTARKSGRNVRLGAQTGTSEEYIQVDEDTARWSGVIGVEGELTGDGRFIQPGALRWEELPIPLRYVSADVGAHQGAQVVGKIETIERNEETGEIWATGSYDLGSEVGREAARQCEKSLMNGVSMDLDDVAFEVRIAEDAAALSNEDPLVKMETEEADEDGRVTVQSMEPDDEVMMTTSARIRAATQVSVPAFSRAKIAMTASAARARPALLKTRVRLASSTFTVEYPKRLRHSEFDVRSGGREASVFNWVDDVGGLPEYIRDIADALMKKGKKEGHAIAIAVNVVKKACKTGDLNFPGKQDASGKTRAKACAAVASWEEKKARAKADSGRVSSFKVGQRVKSVKYRNSQSLAAKHIRTVHRMKALTADGWNPEKQWRNPENGQWIDMPGEALANLLDALDSLDIPDFEDSKTRDDVARLADSINNAGSEQEVREVLPEAQSGLDSLEAEVGGNSEAEAEVAKARTAVDAFELHYVAGEESDLTGEESTDIGAEPTTDDLQAVIDETTLPEGLDARVVPGEEDYPAYIEITDAEGNPLDDERSSGIILNEDGSVSWGGSPDIGYPDLGTYIEDNALGGLSTGDWSGVDTGNTLINDDLSDLSNGLIDDQQFVAELTDEISNMDPEDREEVLNRLNEITEGPAATRIGDAFSDFDNDLISEGERDRELEFALEDLAEEVSSGSPVAQSGGDAGSLPDDFDPSATDPKDLSDEQLQEALRLGEVWLDGEGGSPEMAKIWAPFFQESRDRGLDGSGDLPEAEAMGQEWKSNNEENLVNVLGEDGFGDLPDDPEEIKQALLDADPEFGKGVELDELIEGLDDLIAEVNSGGAPETRKGGPYGDTAQDAQRLADDILDPEVSKALKDSEGKWIPDPENEGVWGFEDADGKILAVAYVDDEDIEISGELEESLGDGEETEDAGPIDFQPREQSDNEATLGQQVYEDPEGNFEMIYDLRENTVQLKRQDDRRGPADLGEFETAEEASEAAAEYDREFIQPVKAMSDEELANYNPNQKSGELTNEVVREREARGLKGGQSAEGGEETAGGLTKDQFFDAWESGDNWEDYERGDPMRYFLNRMKNGDDKEEAFRKTQDRFGSGDDEEQADAPAVEVPEITWDNVEGQPNNMDLAPVKGKKVVFDPTNSGTVRVGTITRKGKRQGKPYYEVKSQGTTTTVWPEGSPSSPDPQPLQVRNKYKGVNVLLNNEGNLSLMPTVDEIDSLMEDWDDLDKALFLDLSAEQTELGYLRAIGSPDPEGDARAIQEVRKKVADSLGPDTLQAASPPLDPDLPPVGHFSDPKLREPTAITITKDGRVYGHLATWGTCHLTHTQRGKCVEPPKSNSGYAYFNTGSVMTAEGAEIPCGRITLDTGHASDSMSPAATLSHYDNTGTTVADVVAGEDRFGIWVSGSLRPGLKPKTVRALRMSPLSGDWRRIGTGLELVAALAVNVGGFPVPRTKGRVASNGAMSSLVAAGMLPPKKVSRKAVSSGRLSSDDLRYLKRLAARERRHEQEQRMEVLSSADELAQRLRNTEREETMARARRIKAQVMASKIRSV